MFRRWSPVLAEASANEQEFGLLQRRLADAADFVSAALAALAEPQPGQKANQELAMHELLERLCKLSLRRFLAHSHEWHTGQLHIQQRERDAGENGGEPQCWPQVLTTPWRYQDVLITELGIPIPCSWRGSPCSIVSVDTARFVLAAIAWFSR
jgi:hypothetical protein